jgi:ethanolamine utilization protein EutP (predicted NTPase)
MLGGKIYRNTLPHSCPGLGFEEKFMYKTSLSQLCSVDIITVLHNAGGLNRGASCGLGKFQPMEKTRTGG